MAKKKKPKPAADAADKQPGPAVAKKPAAGKKPKAEKAAKKKPPSKAELEEMEEARDLLERIEEAEEECQTARTDMDDARESYKLAKQSYAHHVDSLRMLVRARKEKHPLFDQPKQQELPAAKADAGAAPKESNPTAPSLSPSPSLNGKAAAWRYQEIDALREASKDVTEKHLKALRGSRFETLGELADMMDRRATFWHQEVKGIGKDGKAPIEDALGIIRARADEPREAEKPAEPAAEAQPTKED